MRRHPLIYVPTPEILVVPPARGPTFKGFFTVERFRGDHRFGIKTGHWEFENLITDAGLNALGVSTTILTLTTWLGVGTGSTAPAVGQTALVTEIAPAASNRTNSAGGILDVHASGASFVYWSWKQTRVLVEAQGNGNLTELGYFTASSAGTMWTRQLFKDGAGVPTTIVKTAADQLRVTYELRIYPPTVDVTGTITISGSNYDYVLRPSDIDSDACWGSTAAAQGLLRTMANTGLMQQAEAFETNVLGSTSARPAGTPTGRDSSTIAAYVTGNFYRDLTYIWEPGTANFATGIGAITYWGGASNNSNFQEGFTPKLTKTNLKRLTLVQRLIWARHP